MDLSDLPTESPQARLEWSYIKAFLYTKGYTIKDLKNLPEADAKALMTEACLHASSMLALVEHRSRLVNELQE